MYKFNMEALNRLKTDVLSEEDKEECIRLMQRLPGVKEKQFESWAWCNKHKVARCTITSEIFNPEYNTLVKGILLEDREGNKLAEEYFRDTDMG